MSNEKFTPGPWFVTTVPIQSRGGGQVCHKIGTFVACIYDDAQNANRGIYSEELKANANLISSSPDMYEALKAMVKNYWADYNESEKMQFRESYPNSVIIKAESALAAASPSIHVKKEDK